ncbi:MAG TPA: SCO family protein [Phycisphaerae bacterium]|nr:SCO family protein [Phycisphaerae bacterium]
MTRASAITHYHLPIAAILLAAALLLSALPAHAEVPTASTRPAQLSGVKIVQLLGHKVPGDIQFRDENGNTVTLAQLQSGRPVVLALVYFSCPALCTVILNNTLSTLKVMPLTLGKDYDVWTISFDPRETSAVASEKHDEYVRAYDRTKYFGNAAPVGNTGPNWHFLTGDQANITRLTQAVGFHYKWDAASQQFYHPAGLTILSPDRTISRYFFGVNFDPTDLRLSLDEAAHGKIGSVTDTILLCCYHYDPTTGRYGLAIVRLLQIFGALTILVIGGALAYLFHIDRRRTRALLAAAHDSPRHTLRLGARGNYE